MERMIATFEDQHCAKDGRDLDGHIVYVRAAIQESQPSAGSRPHAIHVQQHGYNFAFRVRVDLSIFLSTIPTYGEHCWSPRQPDGEFLLHDLAEFFPV